MTSLDILRGGVADETYRPGEPLTPQILDQIRRGALNTPLTDEPVKTTIRRDVVG